MEERQVKIAYAYRRSTFYPYTGDGSPALPEEGARDRFLARVRESGFQGIELGLAALGRANVSQERARELAEELDDAGTPCVALGGGGGFCHPGVAAENRRTLEKAVQVAEWMGTGLVNTALVTPPRDQTHAAGFGAPVQHGSSRLATEEDFVETARVLREVGEMAGASGVSIVIEVHENSIADNSWSTLRLLELTGSPYVFANPDLGNIYYHYDVPEETMEQAIVALAPYSRYWHCKNLYRVHVPETERAYFIGVPLPDGDIDYHFAISAMVEAGYDGYLAIEGARDGDQLHKDRRSVEYVKSVVADLAQG